MKRFLAALSILAALALAARVFATEASCGSVVCDATCGSGFAAVTGGGISTFPMCVEGSPTKGCQYSLCSHASSAKCAAVIVGDSRNCNSDGDCKSGEVCVSDSGDAGCGTGFAQCMKQVTTTTTTATTTTTVATTTTTS